MSDHTPGVADEFPGASEDLQEQMEREKRTCRLRIDCSRDLTDDACERHLGLWQPDFRGLAHIEEMTMVVLDFGKFRTEPLDQVPGAYLRWMLTQQFPRDLVIAVRDVLDSRTRYHCQF